MRGARMSPYTYSSPTAVSTALRFGKGISALRFRANQSSPGKRVADIMFIEKSSRVAS